MVSFCLFWYESISIAVYYCGIIKFFVIRKRLVVMFYRAKTPRLSFQILVDIQSNFDKNPHFRPFYVEKSSYNKMRCKMK